MILIEKRSYTKKILLHFKEASSLERQLYVIGFIPVL